MWEGICYVLLLLCHVPSLSFVQLESRDWPEEARMIIRRRKSRRTHRQSAGNSRKTSRESYHSFLGSVDDRCDARWRWRRLRKPAMPPETMENRKWNVLARFHRLTIIVAVDGAGVEPPPPSIADGFPRKWRNSAVEIEIDDAKHIGKIPSIDDHCGGRWRWRRTPSPFNRWWVVEKVTPFRRNRPEIWSESYWEKMLVNWRSLWR